MFWRMHTCPPLSSLQGLAVAAAVSDDMTSCTVDKKKIWLWVAFVVALCNIAFGFYFYFRISQKLGEGKRMFTATWRYAWNAHLHGFAHILHIFSAF